MNQEHIGKFISERRKSKKLTQSELAEKLGVTDRTISNWENGKCMPDLSLFKPLYEILEITINELMSGETILTENYQEKLEENIVNTINYTNQKKHKKGLNIVLLGLAITIISWYIIPPESSWISIYLYIGTGITIIGIYMLIKKLNKKIRITICITLFLILINTEILIDYKNIQKNNVAPRFKYTTITKDRVTMYKTLYYNVFSIHTNENNEYFIINTKKKYTIDNINIFPFNKNKSSIENIIKYQNEYIGNNSNIGNLILNLPLAEYGYDFEIKSEKLELIINYRMSTSYNKDYIKQSLVYNSVSIFLLIENVDKITYNFSGSSFNITRKTIEENYDNYKELKINKKVNQQAFKKYVEEKINEKSFTEKTFNKLFNN